MGVRSKGNPRFVDRRCAQNEPGISRLEGTGLVVAAACDGDASALDDPTTGAAADTDPTGVD
jgi:hypothetical protein